MTKVQHQFPVHFYAIILKKKLFIKFLRYKDDAFISVMNVECLTVGSWNVF